MALPRPAEVLTALQRLGFKDTPSVGDHVSLSKLVKEHPDGPVTIKTGIDMGKCSKRDVARIKRQTKLTDSTLWKKALSKDLPKKNYEEHLHRIPKEDLVPPYFKEIIKRKKEQKKKRNKKS